MFGSCFRTLAVILFQIFFIKTKNKKNDIRIIIYRKEKETKALEVVTDDKNDKPEKNDWDVHNKRTWNGTCVLFCVPPSFVLRDTKRILSCTNSPLNESSEELRTEQWCLYFHSSFLPFFQD